MGAEPHNSPAAQQLRHLPELKEIHTLVLRAMGLARPREFIAVWDGLLLTEDTVVNFSGKREIDGEPQRFHLDPKASGEFVQYEVNRN